MFGKCKIVSSVANKHDCTTLISSETTITGDIHFTGSAHIEGSVNGNISAELGLLTIAHCGSVEGDIRAQRVVVDGHVRGNVFADEHLELASGAVITGNVFYSVIEMTKGAQVNGSLEHHPNGAQGEQRPLLKRSDTKVPIGEIVEAGSS